MFELVPPKSMKIEYMSVFDKRTYTLKVFDFEEHGTFRRLLLECSNYDEESKKVSSIDNERYAVEIFKIGVASISGVKGKFTPSWDVINEISSKIVSINETIEMEK
jgi:hypothetical protein